MIVSFEELALRFHDYVDIKGKIAREIKAGRLFPFARGYYETSPDISGKYLAGTICGPSYLSFESALATYGLIPEAVWHTYTSATFRKRKTKRYQNAFGTFLYRDIPETAYPLGILLHEDAGYTYQIATPEKALCDKLYTCSPVANLTQFEALLFEDLRIDEERLKTLDKEQISHLCPFYFSTNLKFFAKFLRRF